ncbi:MAG TPA: flagellar filament capping protein FliD [Patescibacteria group bacterium]|nr:flagellar filament capping protein FliD [Patescibacteria group bacterium]
MSSVSGTSSVQADSSIQQMLDAYRKTLQGPVKTLKDNQTKAEKRQVFFNGLRSRLETLTNHTKSFQEADAASKFSTRKITSSDTSVLTVSATGTANVGVGSVRVERLASNDILISDRKNLADTFGITAGSKSFDINVNGTAKTVSVLFDGTETNESAMQKISAAINGTADIGVTGGFIKDTSTTGRLTMTSKISGADNSITFTDTDGVLAQLGITNALNADPSNRTTSTSTSAGFKKAVASDLNAKLDVNGVEVLRGTNTIDDVIQGVTLTLLKPQQVTDPDVTLTTSADVDKLTSNIKPMLDAFNDLMKFVKQEMGSSVKGDSAVRSLYSKLRSVSGQEVTSAEEGNPKYLSGMGLKIGTDGTLSIGDKTVLEDLLKSDPKKISDLFTSSDGFAAKTADAVKGMLGDEGLVASRTTSLRSQIQTTMKRTQEVETRINKRVEMMRKEYETLQKLFTQANNQMSLINNFSYF